MAVKTKKTETPAEIDPEALYDVSVGRRFAFERVEFGPLITVEIRGRRLARLLDSEHAPYVTGYRKKG